MTRTEPFESPYSNEFTTCELRKRKVCPRASHDRNEIRSDDEASPLIQARYGDAIADPILRRFTSKARRRWKARTRGRSAPDVAPVCNGDMHTCSELQTAPVGIQSFQTHSLQ